jgi:hypothetical protein
VYLSHLHIFNNFLAKSLALSSLNLIHNSFKESKNFCINGLFSTNVSTHFFVLSSPHKVSLESHILLEELV